MALAQWRDKLVLLASVARGRKRRLPHHDPVSSAHPARRDAFGSASRWIQGNDAPLSPLPLDIAFLPGYCNAQPALDAAVRRSALEGVPASTALLAGGGVSQGLFYRCLANHLGLPFVDGFASLAAPHDAPDIVRRGRARLTPGSGRDWLLAPDADGIATLLAARARTLALPKAAITTPAHLAALARHRDAPAIARGASDALPLWAPTFSAKHAIGPGLALPMLAACLVAGLAGLLAPTLLPTLAGVIFFAAMVFRLLVVEEGRCAPAPAAPLVRDRDAPVVSILVPLYREARMARQLIESLERLDYPRSKLEIKIVLEAGDTDTRDALRAWPLSPICEIIVAPVGAPRTKPRALNAVLPFLKGSIVTIFDAEDVPDANQLRMAAERFRTAPETLACVQASLAINNGRHGILPRLFAIEYAALFEAYNRGVCALGLPLALGGTSNYLRVSALREVGGWDAWNVAEDADLGFRLARLGYRTDIIRSTTFEEAPTCPLAWSKQRRRWTKGWMQTALVLGRDPVGIVRDLGAWRAGALALMMVNLVVAPIASVPITIWMMAHLATHGLPDPHGPVELCQATLWTSVLCLGIGSTVWTAFVGIRARRITVDALTLLAVGPYQAAIAVAAWAGLYDLVTSPYHWHKTEHGLDGAAVDVGRRPAPRRMRGLRRMPRHGTRSRQAFTDAG